jgi:hypothetical protein
MTTSRSHNLLLDCTKFRSPKHKINGGGLCQHDIREDSNRLVGYTNDSAILCQLM